MRDSILGRNGGGRRVPANAMTVGFIDNPKWTLKDGYWVRDEDEVDCLHESMEQSPPESQKDGAHALVCTCPECQVIF